MRALFACALMLLFSTPLSSVRAETDVILLETSKLRPDLCVALRIQLTGVAAVRCRPDRAGALPERLAHAASVLTREQAQLGVLLERDPDPQLVRMYLVGARSDQAVIAIERIEDRRAPDIDRSLALKVRAAVEVMRSVPAPPAQAERTEAPLSAVLAPVASAPAAGSGGRELADPIQASPATSAPPSTFERPSGRALLEAGGALSSGTNTRALGLLAAGFGRTWGSSGGELMAGARLASQLSVESAAGWIEEREWGLSLAARAHTRSGRLTLGALLELGLDRASARGETRSGVDEGDVTLWLPHAGVGVDVRLHVFEHVALRLAPTIELHTIDQRFAVDQLLLALGRTRVLVPLTVLFEIPFAKARGTDAN